MGPCAFDEDGEGHCAKGKYIAGDCITWPNGASLCAPHCDRDPYEDDDDYCKQYFGPDACCGAVSNGQTFCFAPPFYCD